MWHIETFNARGHPSEMEDILRWALVYWRSKGFNVKVFVTQYSLGPAQFWLCTELDSFADLEQWPAMATGDDEGREIMEHLLSTACGLTASIVKELEA